MVLPKSGGLKTAKKTAPAKKKSATAKKITTAKKPSKTAKTSPKGTGGSSDAALKARLKKLLEKEYAATSSKSKSSSAGSSNPCGSSNIRDLFTSEVQQYIIKHAKKEGLAKSTKKDGDFFKKQDNNKTTTAAKKATAVKSTTKKTVTKSTAAGSSCPDGTCPFVKKKTTAKKASATTKTATGTKRKVVATKTDAKKPRTVAAKKTAAKKASACGPCGANCGCSSSDNCATGRCGVKKRGRGGGCCDDDDDDNDDDDSSSIDDSDWTDSDSSDDGGCGGGGGCGPPPRRGGGGGGRGRGRGKPRDSSSSSDGCPDGKCPFVRRRDVWNCEDVEQPPNDNGNADNDAEKSVVPYVQNGHTSTDDDDDYNIFDDLRGEFDADNSSDYSGEEEGSEEQDNSSYSSDDSAFDYSSDDFDEEYSFEDDSDDDEYQLPDDENEDLFIRRGDAKIYEVNNSAIQFDSDDSTAQIFEIPTSEKKPDKDNEKNDDSDDSCPQLVPIDFAALNGASGDEYYSFSEDDDSSDYSQEDQDPPNMKPAIFAADNSMLDDSFPQNFSMLQSSFECCENDNDVSMEYVSPLQRISGSESTPAKYNVVTIGKPKSNGSPLKSPKLTSTVELDQSLTEDLPPMDSKFYNSLNSYQVLLLLKKTIYFHGILKVKLIAGGVNIFGYNMITDETIETFSPRGNNLLYVAPQPHSIQLSKNNLKKKLETFTKDFMTADINDLLQNYDQQHDAIVLLERNDRDKRIDMIRKHMKEVIFPNLLNVSSPQYHSEVLLRSRFHSRCYNSLRISPKWDSIDVTTGTKMLVIGGKGVGKSTFTRYMINKNLAKFKQFVLIDLDIGQPEIFLPQTISVTLISRPILGPGYFYGLTPSKAYLFGDINVILSPLTYITNVKQLLQYCRDEPNLKNIPWIVNTMGYNKGFGSELLSVIIGNLRPTDVIQLESAKQYNNFDFEMNSENVRAITRNIYTDEPQCSDIAYNLFVIDSAVPFKRSTSHGEWDMTPKDIRFCMIIAMLGSLLSERDEWLTDVKPYCVPIDELNIICFGDDSVTKTELLEVVNGNMVYLCDNSSATIECHGIGIVRGIDMFQRKLYILPSVSQQSLAKVNTIAVCNIPLPTSILLNQGPKIKGLVPYTYNTDNFMSSKHVPSHIYRPQHFLQGSHKRILNE